MRTRAAGVALAALLAGCSGRAPLPSTVEPAVATAAVETTAPDRPLHALFEWRIQDGEARFSGRGSARIEPPYRARLDLFGPRGDGYLSAALVDDEVRLPAGAGDAPLPPPALMWAVLGVVAPPDDAVLVGTRETDEESELHYDVRDSRLRYVLRGGLLRAVYWDGGGRRMVVELSGSADARLPREAVYRDWSGYTELRTNLERVDEAEPFSPEIWTPGA